jgi:hypothetical protein
VTFPLNILLVDFAEPFHIHSVRGYVDVATRSVLMAFDIPSISLLLHNKTNAQRHGFEISLAYMGLRSTVVSEEHVASNFRFEK